MVILGQQNCISGTNKIPEYARDFKNEYLFIRGINKEFKYFVDNINEATRGLFENHRVDKIKKFIKKFLLAQKLLVTLRMLVILRLKVVMLFT